MPTQPDLIPRHPPDVIARANRQAAESALHDWHYPEAERIKRAAYYAALADDIERTQR